MLVKAKMGFWVCLLYYPNLNFWKIPVFFKIKKNVCYFMSYILTNWNLQACLVERTLSIIFSPVSFCSVLQCLKSHLSLVPLCECCLCPDRVLPAVAALQPHPRDRTSPSTLWITVLSTCSGFDPVLPFFYCTVIAQLSNSNINGLCIHINSKSRRLNTRGC